MTIKRTQIDANDTKMQEIRKKLGDTISYLDTPLSKAELLNAEQIQDRVRREIINNMLVPQLKDLNLGQKYEIFCYDKKSSYTLQNVARYTLTIVDSSDPKVLKKRTCAAFITP